MNPTLYVSDKTRRAAEQLLRKGTGDSARDAVAMLLMDDGGGVGGTDCGALLSKGLAEVIKRPHEALGVAAGASEGDVRKAFRKQALRYHPDKTGGTTTQLFQSLTTASQRAADPSFRPPPAAAPAAPPQRPAPAQPAPSNTSSWQPRQPPPRQQQPSQPTQPSQAPPPREEARGAKEAKAEAAWQVTLRAEGTPLLRRSATASPRPSDSRSRASFSP